MTRTVQKKITGRGDLPPTRKTRIAGFDDRAPKKIPPPPLMSATSGSAGLLIRYRAISDIKPYAKNSRTHSAKQIAKLEASLARFGWTNPLLMAGSDLLAGHARLQAAIGMADRGVAIARNVDPRMVPTIDLSAMTTQERRAYVIADNRLAEDAGWDRGLLRLEFEDLQSGGFDLSLTGFGLSELAPLLGLEGPAEAPVLGSGLRYQIIVECADERDQAAWLERLRVEGLKVTPLIL